MLQINYLKRKKEREKLNKNEIRTALKEIKHLIKAYKKHNKNYHVGEELVMVGKWLIGKSK